MLPLMGDDICCAIAANDQQNKFRVYACERALIRGKKNVCICTHAFVGTKSKQKLFFAYFAVKTQKQQQQKSIHR